MKECLKNWVIVPIIIITIILTIIIAPPLTAECMIANEGHNIKEVASKILENYTSIIVRTEMHCLRLKTEFFSLDHTPTETCSWVHKKCEDTKKEVALFWGAHLGPPVNLVQLDLLAAKIRRFHAAANIAEIWAITDGGVDRNLGVKRCGGYFAKFEAIYKTVEEYTQEGWVKIILMDRNNQIGTLCIRLDSLIKPEYLRTVKLVKPIIEAPEALQFKKGGEINIIVSTQEAFAVKVWAIRKTYEDGDPIKEIIQGWKEKFTVKDPAPGWKAFTKGRYRFYRGIRWPRKIKF